MESRHTGLCLPRLDWKSGFGLLDASDKSMGMTPMGCPLNKAGAGVTSGPPTVCKLSEVRS